MSRKSALYVLALEEGKLLLMYSDQNNYPKFKAGDENALFNAREHYGSLIIEFEDGKPKFDGFVT